MGQSQGLGGGQAETQNLCSCFQFAACWTTWGVVRMVASTSPCFSVHPCRVLGPSALSLILFLALGFLKNVSHEIQGILGVLGSPDPKLSASSSWTLSHSRWCREGAPQPEEWSRSPGLRAQHQDSKVPAPEVMPGLHCLARLCCSMLLAPFPG